MTSQHPKRKILTEKIEDSELEDIIFYDGFDDEILGMADDLSAVCYSKRGILLKLMTESDMQYEEAVEYYEFNIACLYVGTGTPKIIDDTMIKTNSQLAMDEK